MICGNWVILFWSFIQSEKFEEIKGISGIPGCYFVLIQELEFQLLDLDHGGAMENSVEKL